MRQLFNRLCALIIISLFIPISSYADLGVAPDYDAPASASSASDYHELRQGLTSVGLASNAPRHQDSMAAVDYASVHDKNLTTKEHVLLAKRDVPQDCKDADGTGLQANGAYDEATVCPPGFVPYEMISTESAQDLLRRAGQLAAGAADMAMKTNLRGIRYSLKCCKAYVGYS